jgi:hypothetical protein
MPIRAYPNRLGVGLPRPTANADGLVRRLAIRYLRGRAGEEAMVLGVLGAGVVARPRFTMPMLGPLARVLAATREALPLLADTENGLFRPSSTQAARAAHLQHARHGRFVAAPGTARGNGWRRSDLLGRKVRRGAHPALSASNASRCSRIRSQKN